ncbi:(S)-beta-bisabolene synthase, partial [Biomphalaria glabrata]
ISFSKVTIWIDGTASQYKGKDTFFDLGNMQCYFGSEHGKGESYGETEVLSQALKRAVHGGKSFRDAKDMVNHLSKLDSNSHRQYVPVNNIERDSNDTNS